MAKNILHLIEKEEQRQREMIGLIPSENVCSPEVMEVLSSCLSSKYAEGYPGRRYYEGNQIIDEIETEAIQRVAALFNVPFVNVQPYSGSPANAAIYFATMNPGDTLLGLKLSMGGHLTHGHPTVTLSGRFYNSVQYGLDDTARIDFNEVATLARKHTPKVIVAGNTAYPFELNFKKFREIADEVGAWLVADISHITGLVIAEEHMSPVPYADIIMSTTHKTFRGPRGAMILATKRGSKRDPELGNKLNAAIIPGMQGGPHNATTAAIAIAAQEASTKAFKKYGRQITKNAKTLAASLLGHGVPLVGNGTETHLMIMDLTAIAPGLGTQVAFAMDAAGIYANKNTVPNEMGSPFYPSGVRIGTPLVTTRGMKESEMRQIAEWIARVIEVATVSHLPTSKAGRAEFLNTFKEKTKKNATLKAIRKEVREFALNYPLFTW